MRVNVREEGDDKVVWYKVGIQGRTVSYETHSLSPGTVPVRRRDRRPSNRERPTILFTIPNPPRLTAK